MISTLVAGYLPWKQSHVSQMKHGGKESLEKIILHND